MTGEAYKVLWKALKDWREQSWIYIESFWYIDRKGWNSRSYGQMFVEAKVNKSFAQEYYTNRVMVQWFINL